MSASTQGNGAPIPELCLRFTCASCRKTLLVPGRKLGQPDLEKCPNCQQTAVPPPLDENVVGYQIVVDVFLRSKQASVSKSKEKPPAPASVEEAIDRQHPAMADRQASSKKRPQGSVAGAHERATSTSAVKQAVGNTAAKESGPSPERRSPNPPRPAESSIPPPRPVKAPPETVELIEEAHDDEPIVYGSQPRSRSALGQGGGGFYMSPRAIWWTIFLGVQIGYPFGSVFLVGLTQNTSLAPFILPFGCFGCFWFVIGWKLSSLIAFYVTPLFVSTLRCPGCYEEYPAVSRWSCSCGYKDHTERHILYFHCPKCAGYLGYLECERCNATMILR